MTAETPTSEKKYEDLYSNLQETVRRQRELWTNIETNGGRIIAGDLIVAGFLVTSVFKLQEPQFDAYPRATLSGYAVINLVALAISIGYCGWALLHRISSIGLDVGSVEYADRVSELETYYREIAITYERMIERNGKITSEKSRKLKWGIRWAIISLVLLALSVARLVFDVSLSGTFDLATPIVVGGVLVSVFLGVDAYAMKDQLTGRIEDLKERLPGSARNRATSRRIVTEAYGRGNSAVLTEALAEEFKFHAATWTGDEDRSGYRKYIESLRARVPDASVTVPEQLAEGDRVMTRFRTSVSEAESDSHSTVATTVLIDRFENGRLVETSVVRQEHGKWPSDDVIVTAFENVEGSVLSTDEVTTTLSAYEMDRDETIERLHLLETRGKLRKKQINEEYVWWPARTGGP